MDRTERFYRIRDLLHQRRVVSINQFLDELEVSRATFKRDLEYLRDRFSMPIVWDRDAGGYRLDTADPVYRTDELPGLWFSAGELHALLTMETLLRRLQPGLLGKQVAPLRARVRKLLETSDHSLEEVERRIRVLQMGSRPVEPAHFQTIASALLARRRLDIAHYRRQTDETIARTVSPQRFVHYRDNWYLDAWCHMRKGLRTFSADAIRDARIVQKPAKNLSDDELDNSLTAGFGIFSGKNTETAVLRFSPLRARWVSRERWHADQSGEFELDGAYILRVPYSDPRELIMDVLKYGADVEVLAPASLRERARAELDSALSVYGFTGSAPD